MNDPNLHSDDPVLRDLAALAANDEPLQTSAHVERAITDTLSRSHRPRWFVPVAVAASLLVAIAAGSLAIRQFRDVPVESKPDAAVEGIEFGIVQWARVQVPREYLPQLGIPVVEPGAGPTVLVEVAIGDDGRSHAVRIVQ